MSRRQMSRQPSPSSGSYILSTPSSVMFPEPWLGMGVMLPHLGPLEGSSGLLLGSWLMVTVLIILRATVCFFLNLLLPCHRVLLYQLCLAWPQPQAGLCSLLFWLVCQCLVFCSLCVCPSESWKPCVCSSCIFDSTVFNGSHCIKMMSGLLSLSSIFSFWISGESELFIQGPCTCHGLATYLSMPSTPRPAQRPPHHASTEALTSTFLLDVHSFLLYIAGSPSGSILFLLTCLRWSELLRIP